MTRTQAALVVLAAVAVIYALLYAAWRGKQRRHASAAVAVDDGGSRAPDPSSLVVEGTYVSTTVAENRHERVAVQGLGNRSRATLTVRRGSHAELLRFERSGESDVLIPADRFLGMRRVRGMAGKFVGAKRLLVMRWRADDGAMYETGFLPRYRADLERVESALWWHTGGVSVAHRDPAPDPPEEEPTT